MPAATPVASHALMQLSDDTGGKYYYIEDPKDLIPAFRKVSDDLRTQYTLGYYAPAPTLQNRKDGFRTLKIELTDPADRTEHQPPVPHGIFRGEVAVATKATKRVRGEAVR